MQEIVAKVKSNYTAYLGTCWPHLSGGRAPYGELERDVFGWACGREPGRSNKRFVFWHREGGKSTGITYALPGHIWLNDPAATGAVYTKSGRKAIEALMATRGLLRKNPILKRLQPPKNSWHKDAFDLFYTAGATNEAVPSIKVLGSTSQSTGGRIDYGIFDDFETLENSITREARERTLERFREIIRTARDGALLIVVGTYARDQSIYQVLIDEGWEHRVWPLLYPTEEEIQLCTNKKTGECYYAPLILKWLRRGYDGKGRKVKAGDIVQPERFTPEYVAEKRAGSLAEFRRHYMGIRVSAATDEYILRLSDFMVYGCTGPVAPDAFQWATTTGKQKKSTIRTDIEVDAFGTDAFREPAGMGDMFLPYNGASVMHVDPTGYGRDELAWAVASRLNGNYFGRKVGGSRLRPDDVPKDEENRLTISEAVTAIVNDIARFDVKHCQVEAQFGGPYLAELIKQKLAERRLPCILELIPARGQKEERIGGILGPLAGAHRIILDEAVANDKVLQYQITRLTKKKGCLEHDDRVEALAGAIELVSRDDAAIPAHVHQVAALEQERDEVLELMGETPEVHRWGDHRRNQE